MTKEKWMAQLRDNAVLLGTFISNWHPRSKEYGYEPVVLPITAPGPEAARQQVVGEVPSTNPNKAFEIAITEGDHELAYNLLSDAWIGVPESTSCWHIEGFSQAVDLLDDPPEFDEPPE